MDLEFLAPDATGASRVCLSDRARCLCRCDWRGPSERKRRPSGHGIFLFLDGPKWFQYLCHISLDFRSNRRSRELVEVVPILVLDDSRAQRESLVRPDVFPAKVSRIGCPGHVEFENWFDLRRYCYVLAVKWFNFNKKWPVGSFYFLYARSKSRSSPPSPATCSARRPLTSDHLTKLPYPLR